MSPRSCASALVLRPGALGDALLTLPVLHALRAAGAGRLLILGQPASWAWLAPQPDSLRLADSGGIEWLGLFSAEGSLSAAAPAGCTVGVPPAPVAGRMPALLSPAARAALARIEAAVVYLCPDRTGVEQALRAAGVPAVLGVTPPRPGQGAPHDGAATIGRRVSAEGDHAARRLLAPLERLLGERAVAAGWAARTLPAQADPFLQPRAEELAAARARLGLAELPTDGFLALHPGSGGSAKRWPAELFRRLADVACAEGRQVLVFIGPADADVRPAFEGRAGFLRAENFPLREVLALLAAARAYVGNDSGLTHLAARACPTLALFGPTDPRVWAPRGPLVRVLRAPDGSMQRLGFAQVRSSVARLLAAGPRGKIAKIAGRS